MLGARSCLGAAAFFAAALVVACGDDDAPRNVPGLGQTCNAIEGCDRGLRCTGGVCAQIAGDGGDEHADGGDEHDLGTDRPDLGPRDAAIPSTDAGPDVTVRLDAMRPFGDAASGDTGVTPLDLGPSDLGPPDSGPTCPASMCTASNGWCIPPGSQNPTNTCEYCSFTMPHVFVSGCDDGLSCTVDSCAPDASCVHELNPGFCVEDFACYEDGQAIGECRYCDASGVEPVVVVPSDGTRCATMMGCQCCDGVASAPGIPCP